MSRQADRDRAVDDALRRSRAGQSRVTVGAPSDACLDPETLALWIDDGLSAAERVAAERHVADCARCQATLAALVRTAPVPDTPSRPSAAAMRPWWQTLRAAWLAPLTAAAAALVIWIAVPSAPPPRPSQHASPPSASVPVASSPQPAKQEAENAPANATKPPAVERRDEKALVEKPLSAPEQTRQTQQAQAANSEVAAPPPAASPAPPAPPSAALRSFSAAAADSAAKSTAQAIAIVSEIVSPDSMSRWRITGGRVIEHSTDGGATWQEQPTGVTSTLTAGSAPSPSICWVVGQDGVVLLSTDGRTWRRLGVPATTALVSVRAADERTATVTDVNGRTYVTTDGGVRWTQGQ